MTDRDPLALAADYWRTAITDMAPGRIALRGYPIEDLIGRASFPAMIWLLLRGDLPAPGQEALFEAALVAAVDHGPHTPSIAVARMAVTCGLPLNGAMASALNTLDDIHGGAGEQALAFYDDVLARAAAGADLETAAGAAIDAFTAEKGRYLPGFGHRFHPVDPRAGRLLALVEDAAATGVAAGRHAAAARALEAALAARKGRLVPLNIDGATAVIYGELGFPAPLARGLFCLSRAVGILAHAWEETGRGERNKGPVPRQFPYRYDGPPRRPVPGTD